ncbi:MAG: bifunctional glutamate N-acetyltransferase/amino-acid acetyltransferase ArgJ [Acidimicrobiia bacterium]
MSVTAPKGFVAAGVAAGFKRSGRLDLAVVATADRRPVTAAAVFTTNLVAAAPVLISRLNLAVDPRAAAVVLNSGNANAATGRPGLEVATRTCDVAAASLGCVPNDVLVCSTGLIGIPMPFEPIERGLPEALATLGDDAPSARRAAEAIMTTDTVPKEATATLSAGNGGTVTVGGMAKGAAMLSPSMATMLAVLTTDAGVDPADLQRALSRATEDTFNQLTTDSSRSTNDTVIALASGVAGPPLEGAQVHSLTDALIEVCASLAGQMAADAEGATKLARICVRGARSADDARRAARAVAQSQLVKCSLYGEDPYWGRVLSELGASGAFLEPDRVDIAYNGITACRGGVAADHDGAALAAAMKQREIDVVCDLHVGLGEALVTTVDLGPGYIDENKGTS